MNTTFPHVQVALPLPLPHPLTYLWPASLAASPAIGWRVLVPLGRRRVTGYVVGTDRGPAAVPADSGGGAYACREVLSLLDEEPLFGARELDFYRWISRYYLAPLGEVLRTALPGSMNLRSYEGVRVLPEGLVALSRGLFLTRRECEILDRLKATGRMTRSGLQQRLGFPVERWLRSLEEKGFVERCRILKGRQGRREGVPGELQVLSLAESTPPTAEWVSLLPRAQARIVEALAERGPCPREEVEGAFRGAAGAVKALLERGFIRAEAPASGEEPGAPSSTGRAGPTLTREQAEAAEKILPFLRQGAFQSFLLHGITGSGKTEVYLEVIEKALELGKDALVLVPEIALTPQALQRFSSRFGRQTVAVLHSRLTDKERLELWWMIRKGRVRITLGARSAVFAPFRNLGVVVVDEEHDPSYKQQERVRYHGRDLALVRGQREGAVVILGSATPSLESYHNTETGKSLLLELRERYEARPLPEVVRVDMRDRSARPSPGGSLSRPLAGALVENWKKGKKSLLLLNRRGYSQVLLCRSCGHLFRCPHCSVSLTYHRREARLCCHYCEYRAAVPEVCPSCEGEEIQPMGKGTERVEEEIEALLPEARVGRMDRDTTRRKGAHEEILRGFRGEDLDILVGTQMIAKGHDIPEVTLVGVVLADVSLDLPDFRASERTLQLLMQVAGRAGRGRWPGRVFIQTYHPDHYSIEAVRRHDYKRFYDQEIAFRRELNYPPFSRMVNLRLTGRLEEATRKAASTLREVALSLQDRNPNRFRGIELLGPSPAPLTRLKDRFRFHFFLKGKRVHPLLAFTAEVLSRAREALPARSVSLEVDVDPVQVL